MSRKIYTRLTVGELRKAIEGCPDDLPVLVDFQAEYDMTEIEEQGVATWCAVVNSSSPHLRIDATEENRG